MCEEAGGEGSACSGGGRCGCDMVMLRFADADVRMRFVLGNSADGIAVDVGAVNIMYG